MGLSLKKEKNYPRLYSVWRNMKSRCNNPKASQYKDYGGRGITYCSEWESFRGFYISMSSSYRLGLTLDRINVNKEYSPDNCRWSTLLEQANNKRNNVILIIDGVGKTMPEWARYYGLKESTVSQRYYTYKWPLETIFQPLLRKRNV